MTNQDKKRILKKYIQTAGIIEDLTRERVTWRERGEAVTAKLTGMPRGGGTSDKTGEAAARIAAIDAALERRIVELTELRGEIERSIGAVGDDTLRRLLYLRYVEGCTWETIAERMNYSYQWVCTLHGRALEAVNTEEGE